MKTFKLLALFITIVAISCKKTATKKEDDQSITNESSISQVLLSENLQEQKNMYKLLTANEKAVIWKRKFEKALTNKELTAEQKAFITKIKETIDPQLFSQDKTYFIKTLNEKEIKSTAIKLFGISTAHALLCSISNQAVLDASTLNPSLAPQKCTCSKSDDWCDGALTCQSAGCTDTSGGCGLLWAYDCNGNCQKTIIIIT
ncbi:bacteriocin fulvocin C-related protein [Ferruginibacter sp.]